MAYFQVNDQCNGCLSCVQNCPATALKFLDDGKNRTLSHNMTRCARCGNCWRVCPQDAIEFKFLLANKWDEVRKLDLVYCIICGEPMYTVEFRKTLSEKLDQTIEPICPAHREELSVVARVHLLRDRNRT